MNGRHCKIASPPSDKNNERCSREHRKSQRCICVCLCFSKGSSRPITYRAALSAVAVAVTIFVFHCFATTTFVLGTYCTTIPTALAVTMKSPSLVALLITLTVALLGAAAVWSSKSSSSSSSSSSYDEAMETPSLSSTSNSRELLSRLKNYRCACPGCTADVWSTEVPPGSGMTCGSRVRELKVEENFYTMEACRAVGRQFPILCGACNPDTCDRSATPPTTTTTTKYLGNNGNPTAVFPLGLCEADCDSDADCEAGLICYQRNAGSPVPGCAGADNAGYDYCIKPQPAPVPAPAPAPAPFAPQPAASGSFALKLYWQEGYFWQEETRERKWCMRCDSSRRECAAGRGIYITDCEDDDLTSEWEFVNNADGTFQIRLHYNRDLCIEATDRITVQECSSSELLQKWRAVGGSRVWGDKFELRPAAYENACVTQDHHPKQDEDLFLYPCAVAQADKTSFWNLYET